MNITRYHSANDVPCHRLFWLSSKLKTFISYGVIGLLVINNSTPPAQAQKLKNNSAQNSSTSPNYVAPQGGITTHESPNCSNNITFSEYSLGTAINNQYSNKGIIFGGSSPFITTDGANPTSPVLSGSPQFVGAIEGSFVDPRDRVTPVTAASFQLDAGYFDSVGSTALKLYDSQGKLIEQRTNTGQGIFTFTVEGLPVAKWRIESVGDEPAGFAIDNVCFTLQTVKQSPRQYPSYLREGDTLEGVPETDFPASERPLPDYFVPSVSPSQNEEDYIEQEQTPDLETNQTVTPDSSRNNEQLGPLTIAQLSCAGIGTPLDKNTLRKIGKQVNPQATNRDIDNAFERFTLDSEILAKYTGNSFKSPERELKTRNSKKKYKGVVPEAVSSVMTIDLAPFGYGPPIPIFYPSSGFWDAKSYKAGKTITLSRPDYQTQGYLDYLSHYSPAALAPVPKNEHPVGHLLYITTSDVGISQDVLNYAGETPGKPFTPVAVYQKVACLRNTGGNFTSNYLQMGYGILLNANRFAGYPDILFKILPAGRPSSLKF
jgi:hypothetical protein